MLHSVRWDPDVLLGLLNDGGFFFFFFSFTFLLGLNGLNFLEQF